MSIKYNTKQKEAILDILSEFGSNGVTIKQLLKELEEKDVKVGKSTLYRRIKQFEADKLVRSFKANDITLYELVNQTKCKDHLHLVCEKCHNTIHLNCDSMDKFNSHIKEEHGFKIDKLSTVIYGLCKECNEE